MRSNQRFLMAAALVAAGNAGSPMVRREDAPLCQRCRKPMKQSHREGDDKKFWVCDNSICGVVAPTEPAPPLTRQQRRAKEREDAKAKARTHR